MPEPAVISIGNFDGVHRGHRAIIDAARQAARPLNAKVVAVAFDPHPASVLRPEATPPRLATPAQKHVLLGEANAHEVALLKPTAELLRMTPAEFMDHLATRWSIRAMVEGPDFHFGRGRSGNMETLRELGRARDFQVIEASVLAVPLHDQNKVTVRSSVIRTLISEGRVADAARCLGRLYNLTGVVVKGEQRGRTIGVPTANLDPAAVAELCQPRPGVYAGIATLATGQSHAAAISVGDKPTFQGKRLVIEAHLPDFAGDLYDQQITLAFSRWIREQQAFPDIAALKAQLTRDIALTCQWRREQQLDASAQMEPGAPVSATSTTTVTAENSPAPKT